MSVLWLSIYLWLVKSAYRVEGEGGGEVSGAGVDAPLVVRCRLEALLRGLAQQRVQLLTLSYHLVKGTVSRSRITYSYCKGTVSRSCITYS